MHHPWVAGSKKQSRLSSERMYSILLYMLFHFIYAFTTILCRASTSKQQIPITQCTLCVYTNNTCGYSQKDFPSLPHVWLLCRDVEMCNFSPSCFRFSASFYKLLWQEKEIIFLPDICSRLHLSGKMEMRWISSYWLVTNWFIDLLSIIQK